MMKRIVYAFLLLLPVLSQAESRISMRDWMVAMPDSVMPLLSKNNRLDFIDFYDAKMEASVTNRLEGKSCMDVLTDDYVSIRYTKTTDVAMKLLPLNDTTDVLCMVTTVKASADDSRIAFFDSCWRPLEVTSYIVEPNIEDFCSTVQGDSTEWVWSKIDVLLRTYHLCAKGTDLKCTLTATDYLLANDKEEMLPYVRREPIVYRWIDGKYRRYE